MAQDKMLELLQYLGPLLVAVAGVTEAVLQQSRETLQKSDKKRRKHETHHVLSLPSPRSLSLAVVLTYTTDGTSMIAAFVQGQSTPRIESCVFYVAVSILTWAMLTVHNIRPRGPALAALLLQAILISLSLADYRLSQLDVILRIALGLDCLRVLLFSLALIYECCPYLGETQRTEEDEREPLLRSEPVSTAKAIDVADAETAHEADTEASEELGEYEQEEKELEKKVQERLAAKGYWAYLKTFKMFIPFVNPKNNPLVQLCMVAVIANLIAGRVFMVLVPRQLGIITDELASIHETQRAPFGAIGLWMLYTWLNSSFFATLASLAEQRISAFASTQLRIAAYDHFLHLDMKFHDDTKSSSYQSALYRADDLGDIFDVAVTSTVPAVIDMTVALVYFYFLFGPIFSFVAIYLAILYVWINVLGSNWTRPYLSQVNNLYDNEHDTMSRGLTQWPLIANFAQEKYETTLFASAVKAATRTYMAFSFKNDLVNLGTGALSDVAQLLLSLIMAVKISRGEQPVGRFVVLITYLGSLMGPISMLAANYNHFFRKLVDAERFFTFFEEVPSIQDANDAKDLDIKSANFTYEDVTFSYEPEKQALTNVSISVESGQMIGLVGTTGSGKSTLLKLLSRYYDVNQGSIKIDDQDVRNVTLRSLRTAVGIVPQESSLFNETIWANLTYAKPDATEEEVHNACKAAAIHEKILKFPKQYQAKVGERGVKLSGGEKQRIAIAQAFLKNAPILVLDEATSSVDSETEAHIKQAFERLCKGRTTFVIAHRFSTILRADKILVFEEGKIIEQGKHADLVRQGGKYAALWKMQITELDVASELDDAPPT